MPLPCGGPIPTSRGLLRPRCAVGAAAFFGSISSGQSRRDSPEWSRRAAPRAAARTAGPAGHRDLRSSQSHERHPMPRRSSLPANGGYSASLCPNGSTCPALFDEIVRLSAGSVGARRSDALHRQGNEANPPAGRLGSGLCGKQSTRLGDEGRGHDSLLRVGYRVSERREGK